MRSGAVSDDEKLPEIQKQHTHKLRALHKLLKQPYANDLPVDANILQAQQLHSCCYILADLLNISAG